jgi:hypothetical protein
MMTHFFFDNDLSHSTHAQRPNEVVIVTVDIRILVALHCLFVNFASDSHVKCYALLRMRPLSISCAEGFVIISCGQVDYDKSGWRDD